MSRGTARKSELRVGFSSIPIMEGGHIGVSGSAGARAALETFGLVHEHKYVMTRTPHVRWQKLRKKMRCGSW